MDETNVRRMPPPEGNGLDLEAERLEQNGTEKVFGAASIPSIVSIPESERELFLPVGEVQFGAGDFMDCATRSPVNHLEALFSYHYQHQMKQENKVWLEMQGYIKDNRIVFSDRFTAMLSGTTRQGNSLKSPISSIRTDGLIPKKMLPKESWMVWDDYHDKTKITQQMKDLGKEFKKRFDIEYEQVDLKDFGEVLAKDMIGVAGYAWPYPVNGIYPKTAGVFNHAFLLYKLPKFQAFDNYVENGSQDDYTKYLASDYLFFEYGYRIYIAKENVITATPPPLPDPRISILQQIVNTLKRILGLLKENPELVPPQPVEPKKDLIQTFCLAIKKHEGWFEGSRSQRNNNPGNTKLSPVGYLPIYEPVKKDEDGFAIFKDYATGWLYLTNLVKSKIKKHPDWDIYRFFADEKEGFAPPYDNNNSKLYAETVASACGLLATNKLKELV